MERILPKIFTLSLSHDRLVCPVYRIILQFMLEVADAFEGKENGAYRHLRGS